jgi:hypothetical protein
MMSLVCFFSSLCSFISTTKDQYATLRPPGTSDLRMIMMVPFIPHFKPCASLPISLAVDRIHMILYLKSVMIS